MNEGHLDALRERCGDRERLLEVAHRAGARPSKTFYWSSGRVSAVIRPGTVRIARELGTGGGERGLELTLEELRVVTGAAVRWDRIRDRWAFVGVCAAGLPGAIARDFVYQPAGKRAEVVVVGRWRMGLRLGRELVGRDELVVLPRPRSVAQKTTCIAELWRRGECVGPRRGLLLGERWDLGGGLFADLRRGELRVARVREPRVLEADGRDAPREVCLEPGESKFVRAVQRAAPRTRGRAWRRA